MTSDRVGGVRTYVQDLVGGLDADVHVVELGPGTPFKLEWQDDPWEDVDRSGAMLLELEEQLEPDVVHLNGFAHGSLPFRAPVVVAAHSDVVSWWWAVHGCAPPDTYARYRSAVEAGLRAAEVVVAPTHVVAEDLARHYRFRAEPVVVHNGTSFTPARADKEPVVACLGRFWDAAKNVAAVEHARETCPWPIVVAGERTAVGELPREEVRALLARASVFASPARYEPFGLGILEAARSGCALVLGDIPSLREVWGDAAAFAPADDPDAVATALRLLTLDEELRRELAARARRRASRYTVERMTAEYAAIYERLRAQVAA